MKSLSLEEMGKVEGGQFGSVGGPNALLCILSLGMLARAIQFGNGALFAYASGLVLKYCGPGSDGDSDGDNG